MVCKGPVDLIASPRSDGSTARGTCTAAGSPRRCGGQGDVLAGAIATFLAWAYGPLRPAAPTGGAKASAGSRGTGAGTGTGTGSRRDGDDVAAAPDVSDDGDLGVLVALAGCTLARTAARVAFGNLHRSTTTPDIIASIPDALRAGLGL